MEKRFSTPVSMFCTQSEFETHLQPTLFELGYQVLHSSEWPTNINQKIGVTTNHSNRNGTVGPISSDNMESYGRIFIKDFNPPLFLALAAMSNMEYGVPGEYWTFMEEEGHPDGSFTHGKMYKAYNEINMTGAFIDNRGARNGYSLSPFKHFRKSTVEELIKGLKKTGIREQGSFPVTRSQMVEIYTMACSEWKKVIDQKIIDLRLHIQDDAELDGEFVNQMFRAATQSQKKVLLEIFPSYSTVQNPIHDKFVTQRTLISRTVREMSQLLFDDPVSIQIADGWADSVGKPELRGKSIGFSTINFDVNLHKEGGNIAVLEFIPKTE